MLFQRILANNDIWQHILLFQPGKSIKSIIYDDFTKENLISTLLYNNEKFIENILKYDGVRIMLSNLSNKKDYDFLIKLSPICLKLLFQYGVRIPINTNYRIVYKLLIYHNDDIDLLIYLCMKQNNLGILIDLLETKVRCYNYFKQCEINIYESKKKSEEKQHLLTIQKLFKNFKQLYITLSTLDKTSEPLKSYLIKNNVIISPGRFTLQEYVENFESKIIFRKFIYNNYKHLVDFEIENVAYYLPRKIVYKLNI